MITRQQQEAAILDALCYDQIYEYAYGEDEAGNSTEIRWVGEEWQIIECLQGETAITYEKFGFETAIKHIPDGVLADMFERLELEIEQ